MADQDTTGEETKSRRIEFKRPGYQLDLVISADADACEASYAPVSGGSPLTKDELFSYLGQLKIVEGILDGALNKIVSAAARCEAVQGVMLAAGTPMAPGEPGRILLAAEEAATASAEPPQEGEPLTVDFYQVQQFVNVSAGDLIGTVLPPGSGTPGRSILGSLIPARPGKPFTLKLGKNARLAEDGSGIFAEMAGRVCIRGEEVSVEDVYQIPGDVNFKVGNIDFNGYVEIRGDVLDGFRVKAKGLKVGGNIGACRIETEGDLSFCGMNGQGKGSITCGGTITANFIYETSVECAGDVLVEAEIRSCHIQSLGAVRVNKGGIVGGECVTLAGVEAASLGSVSSLHTNVVTGVSYRDLEELNRCFNELKSLIARFNAQKGAMEPQQFQREKQAITAQIQEIRSRQYERTNPKVNVRKLIYGGVTVTLGVVSEEFREERSGPFSLIENTIEGGFRFLGMTDLAFKAGEIERTFVQQHALEGEK